jgi:hypothetical protein
MSNYSRYVTPNEYLRRYAKNYTDGDIKVAEQHAIVRGVMEYLEEIMGSEMHSEIATEKTQSMIIERQ